LQIVMSCEALQFWIISCLKPFDTNPKWQIALRSLKLLEMATKKMATTNNLSKIE
jgi:hypothetical protein